jgi:amino acid transporter
VAITEAPEAEPRPTPAPAPDHPRPLPPTPEIDIPETRGYRLKNRLLGPPLHTAELEHERLGIPTALAVFSSDCISSSAYATEEILRVLFVAIGAAAFSLVLPITTAMIVVLFFLILSYRETIKEYPTAGGAYMVTRDNFGLLPAQVAGVSLLTDYVLTVSVSTAAGAAALASAISGLAPYTLWISIGFVILIAFGNLRGVKESGKIFAVPTYFFIGIMFLLLGVGTYKWLGGTLEPAQLNPEGLLKANSEGSVSQGIFYGATLYVVLHAFASGGAAVTGVEAISNGVTAFKKPEWKNARVTLFIMGGVLGTLFFGLSALATKVHPVPYEAGTPTVISEIGKAIFGGGPLFFALQAGTMLILVLAANTSFADFPRLASFHAGDNFMPKQLTKRGHRLVFSNGVTSLALAAIVLLLATGAKVDRLIPLYAVGVFTSFTMSQAGMAKHHLTKKEKGYRKGLFVNGVGAVLSAIVCAIILVTKFTHGAWVICVLVPVMVYGLTRLNKQYESEAKELEHDTKAAAEAPVFRRHTVLLLVGTLDRATARGIQYARSLHPDELRAVHAATDLEAADHLADEWVRLGLTRFPLEIVDCPDRRIDRCMAETVAAALADGHTEVTVLVPRLEHKRSWHRLLHDHTGREIAKAITPLQHANLTFVPYQLGVDA